MHLVVVHGWKKAAPEVAKTIAEIMETVVFEAQQKISGGGPAVLANFADPTRAEDLTAKLAKNGVPAFVLDTEAVRSEHEPFIVRGFILAEGTLQLESMAGEQCEIDYASVELLLVATCNAGQTQTTVTTTERKFSLGKTLLAGGLPMTKKVTSEDTLTANERDETIWLYTHGPAPVIFSRGILNYDGFGSAIKLTRELNFAYLKSELRRLAPQACYDDRLLKQAGLIRLLGPTLSPDSDLDLACKILACSLLEIDS